MKPIRVNTAPREDSQTGIVGVSFECVYGRKGKTKHKAYRAYFGANKYKKFSVNKYGERQAFKMACAWREEQVRKSKK